MSEPSPPPEPDPPCTCGHPRALHFKDRGACLASTPTRMWACQCTTYRWLAVVPG